MSARKRIVTAALIAVFAGPGASALADSSSLYRGPALAKPQRTSGVSSETISAPALVTLRTVPTLFVPVALVRRLP
jgi:hypothetical protein